MAPGISAGNSTGSGCMGSLPQNAGIGTLEISHDGLPEFDDELQAEFDKKHVVS